MGISAQRALEQRQSELACAGVANADECIECVLNV